MEWSHPSVPELCDTSSRETLVNSGVFSSHPCGLLWGSFLPLSRGGVFVMFSHLYASVAVTQLPDWSLISWQVYSGWPSGGRV